MLVWKLDKEVLDLAKSIGPKKMVDIYSEKRLSNW